jgi:hypothetical protein
MGIVKSFFRDNGLTITLSAMFLLSLLGMIWSGHAAHNEELQEHGGAAIGLWAYMTSGDFMSALFENWESEFLQMSAYVMLTAVLFQRGSAESRDPDNPERDKRTFAGNATAQARLVLALFLLVGDRPRCAVCSLPLAALGSQPQGGERTRAPSWGRGTDHGNLRTRPAALVRVLPELAVRVPFDRASGGPVDLPST